MLSTEDIHKLSSYLLEVFKDAFASKDDIKDINEKIDTMQNSLDAVLKDKVSKDQEIIILNHRVKNVEEWIDQASPKIGVQFKQ